MEPIKDAFRRLIQVGRAAMERALPVWKSTQLQAEPALQWLKLRPRGVFWASGIGIALAFLVFSGATAAGAALLAWAALRQAQTASERHQEQTNADRQRRITESFSKAVEQLGSDKLEVRLGGIYSLERISKESPDDYWTVMENLTAFVRERSQRNEAERTSQDLEQRISRRAYFLWEEAGRPDGRAEEFWAEATKREEFGKPETDISAALTVIRRRSEQSRELEGINDWRFDLSGAVLTRAFLSKAYLEGVDLFGARLEWADLSDAHLERAELGRTYLECANLMDAHLERAHLSEAHLEGAFLSSVHLERAGLFAAHLERAGLAEAHLEEAFLGEAHLEHANLSGAHLEGADLSGATGLSEAQLLEAIGDAETKLPEGLARPAHWPEIGA